MNNKTLATILEQIRITDLLLLIAIIILIVLLLLVIRLMKTKSESAGFDKKELGQLLTDVRVNNLKDTMTSINNQNNEINELKNAVVLSLKDASNLNQSELYKFLSETKTKLDDLQNTFNQASQTSNHLNANSIALLIEKTTKEMNELKTSLISEMNQSNQSSHKQINDQNIQTQAQITNQIKDLRLEVQKSLTDGFIKNDQAIQDFIAKTAAIEASTRQIENLRKEINQFNNILSNQKTRGNFGEDVLEQIFINIFGDQAKGIFYQSQVDLIKTFDLKSDTEHKNIVVDFMFNITTDNGILPLSIDAKFPYSNYLPLLDENLSIVDRDLAKKKFKVDVKARLKEVKKYIIEGKTAPYAIMFVPAEAVFIDIFKEFPDIIEQARNDRIIIASPSLIVSIIQILQFILKDYRLRSHSDDILRLIDNIGIEFKRFSNRFEEHKKHIDKLNDSLKQLDITSSKLLADFDQAKNFMQDKEAPKNPDL